MLCAIAAWLMCILGAFERAVLILCLSVNNKISSITFKCWDMQEHIENQNVYRHHPESFVMERKGFRIALCTYRAVLGSIIEVKNCVFRF